MSYFRNQRGFTIIEMMVVVVIIGIIAAMAIPSYNKFIAHQRLNGVARELFSDVRGARVAAIKEGVQYAINFKTSTQFEVIKALTPTYNTFSEAVAAGLSTPFSVVTNYDLVALGYYGVTMTVPTILPIFQRTGAVSSVDVSGGIPVFSPTAPPSYVLTNSYGETKSISINAAGYARIQ